MNKLVKAFETRKKDTQKKKYLTLKQNYKNAVDVPKGLYEKCPKCKETVNMNHMKKTLFTCKHCNEHFRMRAVDRIRITVDEGTFVEKGLGFITLNPLFNEGYDEKIKTYQDQTKLDEAYIYGYAEIDGNPCVIGVMDSYFLMGSMGSVVGEKVTKSFEYAIYKQLPMILFTASGGARMQEGIFSLMQMAKTSGAVKKHSDNGLLYISVLTHPTTGGVTASFATLGDIILAEPGALIGFAGPRVIEQTINQTLPDGFQKSEFLLEKGFIDKIVDRKDMTHTLSQLLQYHRKVIG
ncbi:MAG: acetyl-CoA carboxylase, carboxyltransferase subunit beta [Candidatus Izemoplasma sp.]|nr:acetyl-CoA carboxylase, carboxyltransferase subunit beta [Candidatus Izemoplasma sp.]